MFSTKLWFSVRKSNKARFELPTPGLRVNHLTFPWKFQSVFFFSSVNMIKSLLLGKNAGYLFYVNEKVMHTIIHRLIETRTIQLWVLSSPTSTDSMRSLITSVFVYRSSKLAWLQVYGLRMKCYAYRIIWKIKPIRINRLRRIQILAKDWK